MRPPKRTSTLLGSYNQQWSIEQHLSEKKSHRTTHPKNRASLQTFLDNFIFTSLPRTCARGQVIANSAWPFSTTAFTKLFEDAQIGIRKTRSQVNLTSQLPFVTCLFRFLLC